MRRTSELLNSLLSVRAGAGVLPDPVALADMGSFFLFGGSFFKGAVLYWGPKKRNPDGPNNLI